MTAGDLTYAIRLSDLGEPIHVQDVVDQLAALSRNDLLTVLETVTAEFRVTRSMSKTELLQRVRNRLTARARAEERNFC